MTPPLLPLGFVYRRGAGISTFESRTAGDGLCSPVSLALPACVPLAQENEDERENGDDASEVPTRFRLEVPAVSAHATDGRDCPRLTILPLMPLRYEGKPRTREAPAETTRMVPEDMYPLSVSKGVRGKC